MNLGDLKAPFPEEAIHFRPGAVNDGKGLALFYLDPRDVMERLDEVCGMDNWQCEYPWSDGKKVVCRIGIRINDSWVWKANGAGDTDFEADKGALSDAFKRAAVLWGVGQYLYDAPNVWKPLKGKRFTDNAVVELKREYTNWVKTLPVKHPLAAHVDAIRDEFDAVAAIKEGLANDDYDSAVGAYYDLPESAMQTLKRAPTKTSIWTPDEVKKIASDEFVAAKNRHFKRDAA